MANTNSKHAKANSKHAKTISKMAITISKIAKAISKVAKAISKIITGKNWHVQRGLACKWRVAPRLLTLNSYFYVKTNLRRATQ